MAQPEQPLERFKRATGAAVRAIARREDITATFVPNPQGLIGTEARLPLPSRDLPLAEVSLVRGEADGLALKLRHHDAKLHDRQRPADPGQRSAPVPARAGPVVPGPPRAAGPDIVRRHRARRALHGGRP